VRVLEVIAHAPGPVLHRGDCACGAGGHVGAGTVRSAGDAQACANAGARFAVSPGYTSALGRACQELRLPLLPGWPPAAKSWPPRPMVSTN
jgi:2-keto-3-deoxy-6-phosphogluconate aldolase